MRRSFYWLLLAWCSLALPAVSTAADEAAAGKNDDRWLTTNVRALTYGSTEDPSDSSLNPGNAFLRLPRYEATVALRPDLSVETTWLNGVFKPRATATESWWRDGAPAGLRDREGRFFVNEWLVQPKPNDRFVLSFGKEKLLWGPSFLVSPSNLLFPDTEKTNPKSEVEGRYLGRLVWMPDPVVTVTGISQTQRQEPVPGQQEKPFRAVKMDLVGGASMVSVIGYQRRDDRFRLGSFGQWTASDALLLYFDGMVTKGTDALYPVADPAQPWGGAFRRLYDDSGRLFATVTAGGSYTFLSGETVSLEFLYNGTGYGDAMAAEYYRLRQAAADHLSDPARGGLSRLTLGQALAGGDPFLRRYYLMAQVNSGEIASSITVLLRYVRGLEERNGQVSSIIEWTLSERLQLFNITVIAQGSGEFRALLDRSSVLGVEAHW